MEDKAKLDRINPTTDQVHLRMLGGWDVRNSHGSTIAPSDWRTGKTADLVRLLATQGKPYVAADDLIAALWPDVRPHRGQASLRTAASVARSVLGHHHLERSPLGFRLIDCWSDVSAFRELTTLVQAEARRGDHLAVERVALEADSLYRGTFRAHNDLADWVVAERGGLAAAHRALLLSAGESALALGRPAATEEYARRVLAADPFSENASRLLMAALVAAGEIGHALTEYQRCRALLAEELGVDPSDQTTALYLDILRRKPITASNATPGADAGCSAESRLQTALSICLPQRQFARLHASTRQAIRLDPSDAVRSRALTIDCLPDALLGRPALARPVLDEAITLSIRADSDLHRQLHALRCLVAHDEDSPDFPQLWADALTAAEHQPDVNWAWVIMRIATERKDVAMARRGQQLAVAPHSGLMARQLYQLSSAVLLSRTGYPDEAIRRLTDLVEAEDLGRATVLLPEILARLTMLLAPRNADAAARCARRMDDVIGTGPGYPRELCLRLQAVAALELARGRTAAALAAFAGAMQAAADAGLTALQELCRDQLDDYTASARQWSWHPIALPGPGLVRVAG